MKKEKVFSRLMHYAGKHKVLTDRVKKFYTKNVT